MFKLSFIGKNLVAKWYEVFTLYVLLLFASVLLPVRLWLNYIDGKLLRHKSYGFLFCFLMSLLLLVFFLWFALMMYLLTAFNVEEKDV